MRRLIVGLALAVVVAVPLGAQSSQPLVKFDGGIGVIPTGAANVTARGVPPAGQIWVIQSLTGSVDVDGGIRIDGRGLLLGGGNSIAESNSLAVRAVFFCDATNRFQTETVQLDANGDFRIEGVLTPVSTQENPNPFTVPPNPCEDPLLLITNAGGSYFAAGIPKR